ncbi:unnamed protein product [Caenorhabditis angaria]|uniref:Uncharacterized protein n=1 Tax=Caenorhabditis angaria TaxID=860376 RepID=A0A9P1IS73_9PELO|nr:unnamed protein product [Caenorhabditis angaria]
MEEMESGKEENKGNMDGLQEFEAQTVCAIFNEMTTIPEIFQQSGQFCANNILKLTPSIRQVDDNLEIGLLFDSNVLNQTKWIVQCMGKLSIQNPSNYTDITIATIHPAKVTCSFNIHKIYMNR